MAWGRLGSDGRSGEGLQSPHRPPMAVCGSWNARDRKPNRQQGTPAELVGASWRGRWVSGGGRRQAGSGMARSRARAKTEQGIPRPALWQMQGDPSGERAKTRRRRVLVVTSLLAQTDASRPSGQVMGDHLARQPGAVGCEAARGDDDSAPRRT